MPARMITRRTFLALSAALPWALHAHAASSVPVGLELYSVRDELQRDPQATVRAVAQMGYQGVEFYAPYFEWSEEQTKQMRKLLDELGIRCFSTHNDAPFLNAENIERARDKNLILGSKYVVMAWAEPGSGLDGWKAVADSLNFAAEHLEVSGLKAGYHNHQLEFTPIEKQRPIEILAKNTKPSTPLIRAEAGPCSGDFTSPSFTPQVALRSLSTLPSSPVRVPLHSVGIFAASCNGNFTPPSFFLLCRFLALPPPATAPACV